MPIDQSPPRKPPARAKPVGEDSFARMCKELRQEQRLRQAIMGAWFSVSGKTFARWEDGMAFPTSLQAHGVVAALRTHAPAWVARASRLLSVQLPPAPSPPSSEAAPSAPSPAIAKAALEGALFEAAERLGVPSARARDAAVLLFERAALLGLGASEAAAMIRGVP